jgi:hypothetical protein
LIYIDYTPDETGRIAEEKYSAVNSEKFLNTSFILGNATWSKGLNEMTYLPGGYADVALVIEPLKNKTFIKTVTLGAAFTLQTQNLVIVTDQPASP